MNAAEHIVDSYYRLVQGCFTLADRKVAKGNNRQLDILAYDIKQSTCYHIEVGVTHRKNWCPSPKELIPQFDKKFFGTVPERKGRSDGTTDFEKGKSYWKQIEDTYKAVGFDPRKVQRVWVCWILKHHDGTKPVLLKHKPKGQTLEYTVEVMSLRDFILPQLENAIGTSNYDDEILRTLGFVKQRELQSAVSPAALNRK